MKKIFTIRTDKELDFTEVKMRIPDFQNFGQRMGELKRKSFETWYAGDFDPKDFEKDLTRLWISLPSGMKWDAVAEAKLDQFLAEWPELRPLVLDAMFSYYKSIYEEVIAFLGENQFTLPAPGDPEATSDLFSFRTIHFREDGGVGLEGVCTWDDEHGCGVLIRNGKVVATGHASDAFE